MKMSTEQVRITDYDFDEPDPRPAADELTRKTHSYAHPLDVAKDLVLDLNEIDTVEWQWEGEPARLEDPSALRVTNRIKNIVGDYLEIIPLEDLPYDMEIAWPLETPYDYYQLAHTKTAFMLLACIHVHIDYLEDGSIYINMGYENDPVYRGPVDEKSIPIIASAIDAYKSGSYYFTGKNYHHGPIPGVREYIVSIPEEDTDLIENIPPEQRERQLIE